MAQHKTYEELSAFAVPGLEGAFYIPNWLNQEEAGELAHNIGQQKKVEEWKLYHPGPLIDGYETSTSAVQPFFEPFLQKLEESRLLVEPFQYNFNTYTPPNYCIMPHRDSIGSRVAIISLLSPSVLEFFYSDTPVYAAFLFLDELPCPSARLLLEPNSLTILSGPAFLKHMHGMQPTPTFKIDKDINNLSLTEYHSMVDSLPLELDKQKRIAIPVWTSIA